MLCARVAECGEWEVTCVDNEEDGLDCAVTLVDVTYDECVSEVEPEFRESLECVELTSEQEGQMNDCINRLAGRACISQAEMDAYIAAVEAGEDPVPPGGKPPASCEQIVPVLEACEG